MFADLAVIELLVAAGANPRTRTQDGETALHRAAARWKGLEVVAALLAAGADPMARDARGATPLHSAASADLNEDNPRGTIDALLGAGANPLAEDEDGTTPWDLAQENDKLKGSDAYWRMNDARFEAPEPHTARRRTTSPPDGRQASASAQPQRRGPDCEIPGYPTPTNVQGLGLSWCGPSVDFQKRAFALQAAGAWCAIASGSSSTPEQISARHQEISSACETLEALRTVLGGPPCQCPAGYRP